MRVFNCTGCGNPVYFENSFCTRCGTLLGFVPEQLDMAAFVATGNATWKRVDDGSEYRQCANYSEHSVCNWMVGVEEDEVYCPGCRLNRTIPDLSVAENRPLWGALEVAKRRLVYSLLRLRLPVVPRDRAESGLAFDFLADTAPTFSERGRVMTGHAQGVITLDIAEADPAHRERMRQNMDEPYRTILGHFRHESGHYYWDRLVFDGGWLDECRSLFGDESRDYGQALDAHYAGGPPPDWSERFVSAYAAAHPWEDWAETWAHYFHIVDTLETAYQFGLHVRPRAGAGRPLAPSHDFDPYDQQDARAVIEHWLPLCFALNSLNRSMGHEDAYPFVLSPPALDKLGFVHRVIRGTARGQGSLEPGPS